MVSGYGEQDGVYRSLLPQARLPLHPHQSFPNFLFGGDVGAAANAHKPLLIDSSSGAQISCSDFRRYVASLSAGLSNLLGIRQGDVVLLLLCNTIYFPIIFNAVLSIGAVVTTCNPASTTADVARQVHDSSTSFIVAMQEYAPKVPPSFSRERMIILEGGGGSSVAFQDLLSCDPSSAPDVRTRFGDPAAVLYSSGTTGPSKGVLLSHGNFISAVVAVEAAKSDPLQQRQEDEEEDEQHVAAFIILPMFHVAGLVRLGCSMLRAAAKLVVIRQFDFVHMLDCIQRYRITNLPLVPPLVVAFNKHPSVAKFDLSSLRRAASGAAPLKRDTIEEFLSKFPQIQEFSQGYGLTETTSLGAGGTGPFGSAGKLQSMMEAIVADVETGERLPPNAMGELLLRGPTIMQGYLNNPRATAETINKDGWLRTGDLVFIDDEGYVHIVDRLKELIKYKGFQVAPAELEALLLTHPCVEDAAVIPFPDEEAGEIPMAFVVRGLGQEELSEADVIEFVAKHVAPYKRVRRVMFVDAIPKNPSGKILRRELVMRSKPPPSKL